MWFDKIPHNPAKAVFSIHHLRFRCLGWSGTTSSFYNMLNMKACDKYSALFVSWFYFWGGLLWHPGNPLSLRNVYFLIIGRAEGSTFFFPPRVYQNRVGKLSHQRWRRAHRRGICGWRAITDDAYTHSHTDTRTHTPAGWSVLYLFCLLETMLTQKCWNLTEIIRDYFDIFWNVHAMKTIFTNDIT